MSNCTHICDSITRRNFLKNSAAGLLGASVAGGWPLIQPAHAAPSKASKSETLVAAFHKTLTEQQRTAICMPFDHPLRSKVDNNWQITKPTVGDFFTKDQQALIQEIFLKLHSPEYAEKVLQQVAHDAGKEGFGACSVALFGEPGTGKFEFVLSGRHVTRRCDGDSVEGAAFGGPIFYGHAAQGDNEKADHPGNAYWFQALRANEVFKALDGKQRELALLGDSRQEEATKTVKLTGKTRDLPGIPLTELSRDQKDLVRKVMRDLLAPFRSEDSDEAMKLIEKRGFDHLHMAFFKNEDIGKDGVWDVWQIEGPAMVWYFRGKPHIHTWVHIRENPEA
ncbi:MAG: DUF3500 domain-containing protein [Pedosphaera sp.]|nr:DUF3500 domain-containing protein [Pedosphaera sp.]